MDSQMTEEWKTIQGYENYEVSNIGCIRHAKTKRPVKKWDCNGYERVVLWNLKEHKNKNIFVHTLVANAFCKKGDGSSEVNHLDGNKKNNSAINLEWTNRSKNVIHALKCGLVTQTRPVIQYDLDWNFISLHRSTHDACRAVNTRDNRMQEVLHGQRRKTLHGFRWKYCEALVPVRGEKNET